MGPELRKKDGKKDLIVSAVKSDFGSPSKIGSFSKIHFDPILNDTNNGNNSSMTMKRRVSFAKHIIAFDEDKEIKVPTQKESKLENPYLNLASSFNMYKTNPGSPNCSIIKKKKTLSICPLVPSIEEE